MLGFEVPDFWKDDLWVSFGFLESTMQGYLSVHKGWQIVKLLIHPPSILYVIVLRGQVQRRLQEPRAWWNTWCVRQVYNVPSTKPCLWLQKRSCKLPCPPHSPTEMMTSLLLKDNILEWKILLQNFNSSFEKQIFFWMFYSKWNKEEEREAREKNNTQKKLK